MTIAQQQKVRRIRERAVVRAWEYRQRDHAGGVWFRLRRVLVDAGRAFIVDEADADRLERAGLSRLPVGRELSPAKRMFFVAEEALVNMSAREVPVRLTAEFLQATAIVLLPHAEGAGGGEGGEGGVAASSR